MAADVTVSIVSAVITVSVVSVVITVSVVSVVITASAVIAPSIASAVIAPSIASAALISAAVFILSGETLRVLCQAAGTPAAGSRAPAASADRAA
jgi:hypothetical protein